MNGMWLADRNALTPDRDNLAAKSNDSRARAPIKRGTIRAACVRALLAFHSFSGESGASVESLLPVMCEQEECTISDAPATKKYVAKILRSDSTFVRVCSWRNQLQESACKLAAEPECMFLLRAAALSDARLETLNMTRPVIDLVSMLSLGLCMLQC
jgi:hypothetical protein